MIIRIHRTSTNTTHTHFIHTYKYLYPTKLTNKCEYVENMAASQKKPYIRANAKLH